MRRYVILGLIFCFLCLGCGKSMSDLYLKKGMEHYKRHKYQMAIRYFDKSLSNNPDNNKAKYFRSLSYLNLGHLHTACEEMSELVDIGYPNADSTLKEMGCFYFPTDTVQSSGEND